MTHRAEYEAYIAKCIEEGRYATCNTGLGKCVDKTCTPPLVFVVCGRCGWTHVLK